MKVIFSFLLFLGLFLGAYSQQIAVKAGFMSFGKAEGDFYPGFNLGVEAEVSNRWTVSGDYSQGFGPDLDNGTFIFNSYAFRVDGLAKFYFKEAFKGLHFNAGVFYMSEYYRFDVAYPGVDYVGTPSLKSSISGGLVIGLGYSTIVRSMLLGFDTGLGYDVNGTNTVLSFGVKLGYVF